MRSDGIDEASESLLSLDSFGSQKTDRVKDEFRVNSKIAIIPGRLTKFCQPLDLTVNKIFKDNIWKLWAPCVSQEDKACEEWTAETLARKTHEVCLSALSCTCLLSRRDMF